MIKPGRSHIVKLPASDITSNAGRSGIFPGVTRSPFSILFAVIVCIAGVFWTEVQGNEPDQKATHHLVATAGTNAITDIDVLTAKAQASGQLPVILRLNVDFRPENNRSAAKVIAQRTAIAETANVVVQSLAGRGATNIKIQVCPLPGRDGERNNIAGPCEKPAGVRG
jgi:hypothetical protein